MGWTFNGWYFLFNLGGGKASDGRIIRNHIMDAENIVGLFQKYSVPHPTFDLLSVDLDFNDFFIAQSILLAGYTPNVLIVEYNRNWGPDESFTIRYDAKRRWNGDSYFGISALAAARLVKRFGYHTVYFDTNGVNMFAIKKSYLCDYIKRKIGYEITIDELEDYLPTFESVYRRSPPLHIQTAQEFNENKLKNDWIKVDEGGKALL